MEEQSCPKFEELLFDTRELVGHLQKWSGKWSTFDNLVEISSESQRTELTNLLDEFSEAMQLMIDANME